MGTLCRHKMVKCPNMCRDSRTIRRWAWMLVAISLLLLVGIRNCNSQCARHLTRHKMLPQNSTSWVNRPYLRQTNSRLSSKITKTGANRLLWPINLRTGSLRPRSCLGRRERQPRDSKMKYSHWKSNCPLHRPRSQTYESNWLKPQLIKVHLRSKIEVFTNLDLQHLNMNLPQPLQLSMSLLVFCMSQRSHLSPMKSNLKLLSMSPLRNTNTKWPTLPKCTKHHPSPTITRGRSSGKNHYLPPNSDR
jgi:hypothetical protein